MDVKHLVELFFGNRLDRTELVDAGVVDQDVEAAVIADRCLDDALCLGSLGDVAPYGDGLATGLGDCCDDSLRAGLAGGRS
jgi:hypothetical protein